MNTLTRVSKSTNEKYKGDSYILPWAASHSSKVIASTSKVDSRSMPDLLRQLPVTALIDYQKILENLFSIRINPNNQIIGITSTHAHEGTSTIIAILSLLAAVQPCFFFKSVTIYTERDTSHRSRKNGRSQNILLIDAQIKHPTLHHIFGVANQPGLIDYLEKKENIGASLRQIGHSHLKLLPAGTWADNSFYQIDSNVFITLLQQLRYYVYFIFLDIPPLLDYAEAVTLCKLCDGVILNVKSGCTRLETIQEATKLLQNAQVNILGTILNNRKMYVPDWISKRL